MRIYKARQTSAYEDAKNVWEKIKPAIEVYKRMGFITPIRGDEQK